MVRRALEASEQARAALLEKLQGRGSLSERMRADGMTLEYAPENDYLAITFGQPAESVSLPSDAGVYLLLDPDTGELNALEVPFFKEMIEKGGLEDEFWQLAFEWTSAGQTLVHIPPRLEDRAEEALRQLIPA